jgi:hypothetical protein
MDSSFPSPCTAVHSKSQDVFFPMIAESWLRVNFCLSYGRRQDAPNPPSKKKTTEPTENFFVISKNNSKAPDANLSPKECTEYRDECNLSFLN